MADRHVLRRRCLAMWSGRSSIIAGSYTHTSWRCGRCDVRAAPLLALLPPGAGSSVVLQDDAAAGAFNVLRHSHG